MTGKSYDVIVLGTGGIGSAALYHLARRGVRVAGIDQYPPPHDRGSSHGLTRVIRLAYFEHPDYVPLLQRAYELWEALEVDSGKTLYHQTGVLEVGPPDGEVIPGIQRAAEAHNLDVEELSAAATTRRFPQFRVPAGMTALFEKRAGYLLVEQCIEAQLRLAEGLGAELYTGEPVLGWDRDGSAIAVRTALGTVRAESLVVCAGAWAPALLSELGVPLRVLRKQLYWYRTADPRWSARSGCPAFLFELPGGAYYGFPAADELGVKVAEHSGGEAVAGPEGLDRTLSSAEFERVTAFSNSHLDGVGSELVQHATCMYTMTPDGHFLVDRHPADESVVFVAGLSGHGFKFASVLGEVAADLATGRTPGSSCDFLGLARPGK